MTKPQPTEISGKVGTTEVTDTHFADSGFPSQQEADKSIFFIDVDGENTTTFRPGGKFAIKISDSTDKQRTFKFSFKPDSGTPTFIDFQTITVTKSFRGFCQFVFVDDFPTQICAFTVQEFVNGRFVSSATCFRSSSEASH